MLIQSNYFGTMFWLTQRHGAFLLAITFFLSCLFVQAGPCFSQSYDAFLEPNKIVDISSPIRGRISTIHVHEGEQVKAGKLLAELETRVLKAQLASASEAASFHGRIDSAGAMASMRKNRYAMLLKLEKSGNARPQEITRARTDLTVAKAELLSAKDDKKLKKLEADIIRARIEENKLRSPVDGIVTKISKEEAELVGGIDQEGFITIVQLDPLQALFHLPPDIAGKMSIGEGVTVEVDASPITGRIDYISPVIDAQSGTIEVRVTIENSENFLTSGNRCVIKDPGAGE